VSSEIERKDVSNGCY
jgi:hypothetical protein